MLKPIRDGDVVRDLNLTLTDSDVENEEESQHKEVVLDQYPGPRSKDALHASVSSPLNLASAILHLLTHVGLGVRYRKLLSLLL